MSSSSIFAQAASADRTFGLSSPSLSIFAQAASASCSEIPGFAVGADTTGFAVACCLSLSCLTICSSNLRSIWFMYSLSPLFTCLSNWNFWNSLVSLTSFPVLGSFLRFDFNKLSGFNFDNVSRTPLKIPFSFFIPKYFFANLCFLLSSLSLMSFLASNVSPWSKSVNSLPLSPPLDPTSSLEATKLFSILLSPIFPPDGRRIDLLSAIFLFSYCFLILLSASSFFACFFSSICLGEENIFLPAKFPSPPIVSPEPTAVAAARVA